MWRMVLHISVLAPTKTAREFVAAGNEWLEVGVDQSSNARKMLKIEPTFHKLDDGSTRNPPFRLVHAKITGIGTEPTPERDENEKDADPDKRIVLEIIVSSLWWIVKGLFRGAIFLYVLCRGCIQRDDNG
jgi:hypothetical protein